MCRLYPYSKTVFHNNEQALLEENYVIDYNNKYIYYVHQQKYLNMLMWIITV